MKKLLLYIILIFACIGLYIGLYSYYIPNLAESSIEKKRDSLEISIKRQIREAWNNDKALLYFKDHGGAKYLRMDMDAVHMIDHRIETKMPPYRLAEELFPNGRYSNNVRRAFVSLNPRNFDDLYELYYIQNVPWIGTYIEQDKDPYNIRVFTYIPLFVGYKKETISLRDYRPSFDKCCEGAKEYIQKDDPDNRMYYSPHNEDRVNKIVKLRNDYYYFQSRSLFKTSDPNNTYSEDFDFANFNFSNHSLNAFPSGNVSWVYTGFYKVYYLTYLKSNIYLSFNDTKYYQDIESYSSDKRTTCNIFFIILLCILVTLLLITYYKSKRIIENESSTETTISSDHKSNENDSSNNKDTSVIYEEVLKLSNPELFIKPYQPEKLEKANRIYSTALKNKDNINVLVKLLEEAIQL